MVAQKDSGPPHDTEAEAAVVGCLVFDPETIGPKIAAALQDEDIRDSRARRILSIARTLLRESVIPERMALSARLVETSNGYAEDDARYLARAADSVHTAANWEHYVGRVRESARRRDLYELGQRIAEGIELRLPARVVADDARQRLDMHREASAEKAWGWTTAGDLLNEPEEDKSAHLWRDVFAPGTVSLLAGAPKAGKSTILDALAAALERCEPWLDEEPKGEPVPVVIVSEEGRSTLRRRMKRVGAKNVILLPRGGRPAGTSWQAVVEEGERVAVKAGARLLGFDTLRGLAGFQGDDEYKPGPTLAVVQPMLDVADRSGLAVVPVHHRRKAQSGKDGTNIDAVSGSNALTGAVDVVVGVTHTAGEDDPRRTLSFSGRLDAKPSFVVKCLTDGVWRYEYVGPVAEVSSEATDASILAFLASIHGFASKEEIATAVGGRRAKVKERVGALSRKRPLVMLTVQPQGKRYPLYADLGRDPSIADQWGKP